jgi:hypothetical protein
MKALAVAAAAVAFVAAGVKVTLTAAGHTPKVGTRWPYSVHATVNGHPAKGRLTAQVVDPLGTAHPVQYGTTTKFVTNWPFTGTFHDFLIWPKASRGVPVTFRMTVRVGKTKRVLKYAVTPR